MYSDWAAQAQRDIAKITAELPAGASLDERKRLLRQHAYSFHGGTSWGKKVWSRECRKHLELYGLPKRTPKDAPPSSKLAKAAADGQGTFPFRGE